MSARRAQVRAGEAIVPGEGVFVPPGPEESEKESAGGEDVPGAAEEHLPGCWGIAVKGSDLEAAKDHAGSGAAKDGEQGEILQVNDGEGKSVDGGAEFTESEL